MFSLVVSDYGLFSQDDDPSKGKWLEPARTLDFYPLKSGVSNYYCLISRILVSVSVYNFYIHCTCTVLLRSNPTGNARWNMFSISVLSALANAFSIVSLLSGIR